LKRTHITFLKKCHKEFEGHYKDITEIKETIGGMKGVKDSNDSTSPSHYSLKKNLWCRNAKPSPSSNSSAYTSYTHPF
jgi:hypothetical protein